MASSLHKDEPETREKDKASTNGPSRWLSVKKKGPASRSKSRERKLAEDENTESTESGKQEKPEKERFKPLSGDAFRNLFVKSDKEKGKDRIVDEFDPNIAPQKIAMVREMLGGMGLKADTIEIKRALTSPYTNGEPTKAAPLIDIWQKSAAGVVIPYNKNVHMLGAVNVNCVTCYLDALFFSMFAKLAVFECMLSFDFPKDKTGNKKRLARLLCLWVNLVRSGFLVLEDVTIEIQKTLAACGWAEAQELQQQDTTEAFNFITDVLEFPLQPLRMNIAHGGKVDEGDDKIAFERLINVAMPEGLPEEGVKLEECLTSYFNAVPIKVERMAHESEKKGPADASMSRTPQLETTSAELVTEGSATPVNITASPVSIHPPEQKNEGGPSDEPSSRAVIEATPASSNQDTEQFGISERAGSAGSRADSKMNGYDSERHSLEEKLSIKAGSAGPAKEESQDPERPLHHDDQQSDGVRFDPGSLVTSDAEDRGVLRRNSSRSISYSFVAPSDSEASVRPSRDRASSIIQNVYVDEHGNQLMVDEKTRKKLKRQGSSMAKAITIPAWQFFRLVPWHNVKGQPSTDFEVAAEFKKRPVVGVCLKRYAYNNDGSTRRLEAIIDIPEEMKLPYTLISEEQAGPSGEPLALPREYKLVLQSVICHRGRDLNSGHYVCFTRVEPKKLRENRRHDFDPPPDYEQAQWVRHDDLDENGRVQYVSDFQQAIAPEFPYLLFYQVMPLQDDEPPPSESSEELPSYEEEFRVSVDEPSTPVPVERAGTADHTTHTTLDAGHLQSPRRPTSKPSSIRSRPSTEIDHSRKGSDDSRRHPKNPFSSRPSSMNLDSAMQSPVRTPDIQNSPMLAPADESTSSRLSRAAAAFRGKQSRNQSRNQSQAGETRSAGADMINRMTGMLRAASREPLGEPSSFNLSSNANSRANTNARTSVDSAYRPSLENYREDLKPEKTGGFLSRSGSQKKKDKSTANVKEKPDKGKSKDNKGDKTPKGDADQPDRECTVM